MTTRDLIHKWAVYALTLLPIWILDAFILSRYPLFGVHPTLLPLAVVAVAGFEGPRGGGGFGLGVGLLWALSYPGVSAGMVLVMTATGLGAGIVCQYALRSSFPGCFLCSAGALGLLGGLRVSVGLFFRIGGGGALLGVAAAECLLSLCFTPVVYLLFRRTARRVGGTRLA